MLNAYKKRHEFVVQTLQNISGIKCIPADGTFYSFPDVQQVIEKLNGIKMIFS